MFARVLLTLASVVIALTGVLMVDCEWGYIGGDPTGVCATVALYGLTSSALPGIGMITFAVLALIATWVPAARPGAKRRKRDPQKSLRRNIERIGEVGTDVSEPVVVESRSRLVNRLEALEATLSGQPADTSREATEQWMMLLREANDLHNSGDLATEEFRRINTRLLDLFIEPASAISRLA